MNKAITTILLVCSVLTASAASDPKLEEKAQKLLAKFESMQQKADKRVPADILKKANGIILLDRTKAGFIFAYQGGGGIAMVKDAKGKWSPITFMSANEASLGFQIGGQQSFLVIVILSKDAASHLADSVFEFGGEARGTAGDQTGGVEGNVSSNEQPVMIYDEREGLFGGAAVKGGGISPDNEANRKYYQEYLTAKEILVERKVKPTKAAQDFSEKIAKYSKK